MTPDNLFHKSQPRSQPCPISAPQLTLVCVRVIAITSRDHHRSMTFVPKGYELRIRTRRRSEKSLIGSVVYFLGRKRDSGVDSLV